MIASWVCAAGLFLWVAAVLVAVGRMTVMAVKNKHLDDRLIGTVAAVAGVIGALFLTALALKILGV